MTNDQRPLEAPEPAPRRRWIPTFLQLRLGILMAALVLGVVGMSRNDERMVMAAMVIGGVGLILRFVRPKQPTGP